MPRRADSGDGKARCAAHAIHFQICFIKPCDAAGAVPAAFLNEFCTAVAAAGLDAGIAK